MPPDLAGYFYQLSQLLTRYRPYWQLLPFQHQVLPWGGQTWQADLALLTPTELDHAEQTAQLPSWLASHFAELLQLASPLEQASAVELSALPFWLQTGISGRKLEQIDALCQQWLPASLPIVEWCAGKGHLGRILAQRFGQPVTSVEWQPQLCDEGAALADKHQLAQQFICTDVLTEPLTGVLKPAQHLVALHSTGTAIPATIWSPWCWIPTTTARRRRGSPSIPPATGSTGPCRTTVSSPAASR